MSKKINIFKFFGDPQIGKIIHEDITEKDEIYNKLNDALKRLQDTPSSNWQVFGIPTSVINKINKFYKTKSPTIKDLKKNFGGTHLEFIIMIIEAAAKIKKIEAIESQSET